MIRILNFVSSFPSALDLKKVFYWQNTEFLKSLKHTKTQVKLQADWAGDIWKHGEGVFGKWQHRYAVVRNSRLEYWQNNQDAKSGIPPKNYILLSDVAENLMIAVAVSETGPDVVRYGATPDHAMRTDLTGFRQAAQQAAKHLVPAKVSP